MELRSATSASSTRFLWSLAAIGLALVTLPMAGAAQAAPDQDGAVTAAAQPLAASQDPLEHPGRAPRPAARVERPERTAAGGSKTTTRRLKDLPRHEVAKRSIGGLPEVRNTAGESLALTDGACERNVALAGSRGLRLPDGWAIHCVGRGLDWEGGSHWGVTCPYDECPEGGGPYVSISNPTYYVVAHELCHANFGNDELMADACAAEHGASLETSPYS